jgi:signal recognition particle GTPase
MAGYNMKVFMGKKDNTYEMLKRVADFVNRLPDKKFSVGELLSVDSFSWNEKKILREIFSGDYQNIHAWEHNFTNESGKWKYENTDPTHRLTTKILFLFNNDHEYQIKTIVNADDLKLIKNLINKWNHVVIKELEKELGEKDSGYEVTQEMIEFISAAMKKRVEKTSYLNYRFVEAFMRSFYDYDQMCVERMLKEVGP